MSAYVAETLGLLGVVLLTECSMSDNVSVYFPDIVFVRRL